MDSVYKLFICCAESRQIPSDWKLANVIALHKKGPRNRAENYRPVSLTSILCKLYEKLVKTHIFNHVEDKLSFFKLNLVIILHHQCNNNWPLVAGITYFYFNTLVVITIKIEII